MFKPNIRGVSRRSLQWSRRGWLDSETGRVFKHRMLWRSSWLCKLSRDSQLTPILARSGQVLLFEFSDAKALRIRFKHGAKQKTLLASLAMLVSSVLLVMGFPGASKTDTEKPKNASSNIPLPNCERQTENPAVSINSWLANKSTDGIAVVELGRNELGGVQSRMIELVCASKVVRFRLKLTKEDEKWQLTKITRLDDQPGNF